MFVGWWTTVSLIAKLAVLNVPTPCFDPKHYYNMDTVLLSNIYLIENLVKKYKDFRFIK